MTIQKIEDVIQDGMMNYSSYVLLDRALPDLRDGLKPVHRRILYTMLRQKAFTFTKSAHVSGETMKLHPHGSAYGSMVGLVQEDRQNLPLLEGKGNFGMYTSKYLQPAADRYSEVRLSKLSIDMMQDFEKGIVDFIDNYDGTIKMPEVLSVKYPSILTIAQSGIGVGFSSSTASYNINEVIDATIKYIETGDLDILIPDFATKGFIVNNPEDFEKINKTGRGPVTLRGRAEIQGNEIIITEIPYTTTREEIIEKIISLAKNKKLPEVKDVKDLTGLKGLSIYIEARKNTDMELLLAKLYKFTPLQSDHSSNMNILINGLPKVMGVHEVIKEWVEWRKNAVKKAITYDIEILKKKLHLLKGLEKVLLDIDKAVEIIRFSEESLIEQNLMSEFTIDEIQATDVSNMKLRNINKDYIIKKIKDIQSLEDEIKQKLLAVNSNKLLLDEVIKDLKASRVAFGKDRNTKIIEVPKEKLKIMQAVNEPENYPVIIKLTKEGYIYKTKTESELTLKPGDEIVETFETNNLAEILVFTDKKESIKVPVQNIEITRTNELGTFLPSMTQNSDKIVSYSIIDDNYKYLINIYTNNRVAKVSLESFKGARRVLKNSLNNKQELFKSITLKNDLDIILKTEKDKVKFNTKELTLTNSRGATGVYKTRKGTVNSVETA